MSAAATVALAGAVAVVAGGAITGPAVLDDRQPRSPAAAQSARDRELHPAASRSPGRASAALPVTPRPGSARRNGGAATAQPGDGGQC